MSSFSIQKLGKMFVIWFIKHLLYSFYVNIVLSLSTCTVILSTGWVNSLCGGQTDGANGFMFFRIDFDLSEEGLGLYQLSVLLTVNNSLSFICDIYGMYFLYRFSIF